ncbi:MAG: hypothetical protein ACT4OF_09800 [Caulobacteraceae bacterium]
MTDIATPTLAAAPFWERTRASFARAVAAIGAPAVIAAITALTPALRRDIVGWIASLEHIVRKLLFVEAAELKRAQPPPRWATSQVTHIPLRGMAQHYSPPPAHTCADKCAPEGARSNAPRAPDPSRPETWSARFSLAIPRDPRRVPDSCAPRIINLWGPPPPPPPPPRAPRRRGDPVLRLARRLEALRRVLENPLPYARQLAALLPRLKRGFTEVVNRYLFASLRTTAYDRYDSRLRFEAWAAALNQEDAFESAFDSS